MTEFLLFCIATVGMTSIIMHGSILAPFRHFLGNWAERIRERREQRSEKTGKVPQYRSCIEWFNDLINCAQCTGFWCGLFCGLFLVTSDTFWGIYLFTFESWSYEFSRVVNRLLMLFCCGLGGSVLAPLGINLIDWIFYRKMNALRQLEEQEITLAERRAALEEGQPPAGQQ